MPSTFLHELPEPALQNVVQHLSSKPGRANWPHFVDMDDALKAVHPSNPLRGVAQDVFTYLNTIPHYCGDGRWICLPDDTSPSLLTKWFQYAGSSLTELSLSGRIQDRDRQAIASILAAVEENCKALRRLDIRSMSCHQPLLAQAFKKNVGSKLHHLVSSPVNQGSSDALKTKAQ